MYQSVQFAAPSSKKTGILTKINRLITEIDERTSELINAIIHHSEYQRLEASWRSIQYLVKMLPTDLYRKHSNRILILNTNKTELAKDLAQGLEFDQSQLFRLVYSKEFGTPGGIPFSLIAVDFELNLSKKQKSSAYGASDIELMHSFASIGTAAFCPFIAAVGKSCFDIDSWSRLRIGKVLELPIHYSADYQEFRNLRLKEASRFLGLALPRFKLRRSYSPKQQSFKSLRFQESFEGPEDFLWANASIAFAAVALKCYQDSGWFLEMRGLHKKNYTGGVVPSPSSLTWNKNSTLKTEAEPLLEVFFDEAQEKRLIEGGLLPLVQPRSNQEICFFSNQSIQNPSSKLNNQDFEISSMLQYMLCVSRFAHHIKVMMRDKVGSFQTASSLQQHINKWLREYTVSNPDVPAELLRQRPLQYAKVYVSEKEATAGSFNCKIEITPHCQLEHVASSLKLVTELSVGEDHG